MKRLTALLIISSIVSVVCFGQLSTYVTLKQIVEEDCPKVCTVKAALVDILSTKDLKFTIEDRGYIIPVSLQNKDLGAEKRFQDLCVQKGDSLTIKGTVGEMWVNGQYYTSLVDAKILDVWYMLLNIDKLQVDITKYEVQPDDEEIEEEAIPFQLVETKPSFRGGDANAFSEWVNGQLVYPKDAKEDNIQGRVLLQFTVDTSGRVTNVRVLKSVCPSIDAEAVRVVSKSPKWSPGKQRGRAVRVTYTFPVIFQLRGSSTSSQEAK